MWDAGFFSWWSNFCLLGPSLARELMRWLKEDFLLSSFNILLFSTGAGSGKFRGGEFFPKAEGRGRGVG